MSYKYQISHNYGKTWWDCDKKCALEMCADSHTSLAMAEISGQNGYMPPESPEPGIMVRRVEVDE